MKYIMFKRGDQLVPVMFPDFINHREVANALRDHLTMSRSTVVSAGMCELYCLGVSGESSTLEVKSVDGDAQVISTYDYSHGQPVLGIHAMMVREAVRRAVSNEGNLASIGIAEPMLPLELQPTKCTSYCGCMGDDPECPVHGNPNQG